MTSDQSAKLDIDPWYQERMELEGIVEEAKRKATVTVARDGDIYSVDLSAVIDSAPEGCDVQWWFEWDAGARVLSLRAGEAVRRFELDPEED